MATCAVCGKFSGMARVHPACEAAVESGTSVDDVRRGLRQREEEVVREQSGSPARNVITLSGLACPFIVIAASAATGFAIGGRDGDGLSTGLIVGALGGLLIAAIFYNFMKMCALFVMRVSNHLDS